MIVFNSKAHAKQRSDNPLLTLDQAEHAVQVINSLIIKDLHPHLVDLIQQLVWDYENLRHWASISGYENTDHE